MHQILIETYPIIFYMLQEGIQNIAVGNARH